MQWTIAELQTKLKYPIRKNYISWGIDIAKKITGVCILRSDEENVYLDHEFLIDTSEAKVITDAMDLFSDKVAEVFSTYNVVDNKTKRFVIENCYLGYRFFGGRQVPMVEPFQRLCEFHTIFYLACRNLSKAEDRYFLSATEARNGIGMKMKRVSKKHPEIPDCKTQVAIQLKEKFGVEFDDNNKADGFVLSLNGLMQCREKEAVDKDDTQDD
jgi:hypothetical protein